MKPVTFTSGPDTIAGHLFKPTTKPANLAFLFIQGWTGRQSLQAAQALADLGATCLTYDMRGNRSSSGNLATLSRAEFVQDAVLAYDFLAQHTPAGTPIGVVGSSFGSYTGILLSAKRPVACLSLRVPANFPDEGFDKPQLPQIDPWRTSNWRQKILGPGENQALAALQKYSGPVQIIEAEKDATVPHQTVANYCNVVAKSHLTHNVVVGAPHKLATPELQDEYVALLAGWAKRQLP